MRIAFFILVFIFNFQSIFGKNYTPEELAKIAEEIKNEGILLFKSERASWVGTDVAMQKWNNDVWNIGGYFSYLEGSSAKCIFYSKDTAPKVIATITFSDILTNDRHSADFEPRNFTEKEREYYRLRILAHETFSKDKSVRMYDKTSVNIICIIDDKRRDVYIVTAPKQEGYTLFGNDYLLRYDASFSLISMQPLHKGLIPVKQQSSNDSVNVMGSVHTHLPEFSPFITPTDVCTAMLYADYGVQKVYTVVSKDYLSIWNIENHSLAIVPTRR